MAKITVSEFAKSIGKTPARVRQMIKDGIIESAEKIGRDWLINKGEIKAVLKRPNQRVTTPRRKTTARPAKRRMRKRRAPKSLKKADQ